MVTCNGRSSPGKGHCVRPFPSLFAAPLFLTFCLFFLLCLTPLSCTAFSGFQIIRPRSLQDLVRRTAWLPFGPSQFAGRRYAGSLVWVPADALCSSEDEAIELDLLPSLPKPITHFGPVHYDEVYGAVVLFQVSDACPVLNQLFYVEVVLGAIGAVVYGGEATDAFPPTYPLTLSAPVTHIPAVAVDRDNFARLRSAVVDAGVQVEVALGTSTSEMFYD